MRDICRNFQRGSCQYGERCKFLHVLQPQRGKSNVPGFGGQTHSSSHQQQNTNPFGFGSHTASHSHSHQKTHNPFGFGMQNSHTSPLKGASHSDFKQNQFKPFENKWNRLSSNPASRQSDNNSQPVNHKCTDPEVCKRQIAEDFEQEKPLWILTCYSHCKGTSCDIVGDISYEELRAAAYEDAKQGMSLQSIVEKERNILKSKLVEFEKLLSEPYTKPLNSSLDSQNHHQSIGANANPFSRTTQNNGPLSVSSFSQLGASLNMGFERPSVPLMNTPVQSSFFGSGGTPLINTLTQSSFFGSGGNSLASNTANLSGRGISGAHSSPYSAPVELTMFPGSTSQQSAMAFNDSSSTTLFQTTSDVQLLNKSHVENVSGDVSIWLKEKWNPGEIPEEAPPDTFVR